MSLKVEDKKGVKEDQTAWYYLRVLKGTRRYAVSTGILGARVTPAVAISTVLINLHVRIKSLIIQKV